MSGMPSPAVAPHAPVTRPEVVQPRPQTTKPWQPWILLLFVVLVLVTAGILWRRARVQQSQAQSLAMPAIRTVTIGSGRVERTLRLTGITAAANYASLITPNLRGSRSDRGRDSSPGAATSSTGSSSSSSVTSNANSSASNRSSAFTSATTRVGSTTSTGSSASTSSTASTGSSTTGSGTTGSGTSSSAALGSSGIGSTSDSLPPTGGGGGGNTNDFMLVLQNCVPPGSKVHKGDVVAEFDRQYMLLRLDDYKASVVQSEASLITRKSNLDISHSSHEQLVKAAKGSLEKARLDLKTIPVLSDIDAAKARLAFQQAEAKYQQLLKEVPFVLASEAADTRVSELDLEQTKMEFKRAQMNADKMISKAQIDGLVVMQSMFRSGDLAQIQKGDQLWPGLFFMQIVDPRSMVVNATVNQVDVERVRIGQKARVRFDAYPDMALPAHVVSIAAVTKPGNFRASFVKDVAVRLKIDQMDQRVIPDLSVSAEILEDTDTDARTVAPLGAIFEDQPTKPYVYVQAADGWQRRQVELGLQNNLEAEVKSGIKPGEVVALDRPIPTDNGQVPQ